MSAPKDSEIDLKLIFMHKEFSGTRKRVLMVAYKYTPKSQEIWP